LLARLEATSGSDPDRDTRRSSHGHGRFLSEAGGIPTSAKRASCP
jgi:hypothetical protein